MTNADQITLYVPTPHPHPMTSASARPGSKSRNGSHHRQNAPVPGIGGNRSTVWHKSSRPNSDHQTTRTTNVTKTTTTRRTNVPTTTTPSTTTTTKETTGWMHGLSLQASPYDPGRTSAKCRQRSLLPCGSMGLPVPRDLQHPQVRHQRTQSTPTSLTN